MIRFYLNESETLTRLKQTPFYLNPFSKKSYLLLEIISRTTKCIESRYTLSI